jgi:site-specific DNA-methyltransferase (adenine-specific)
MNYKDKFKDKDKNITLYNMDCMELLKNTEDSHFDLAIVDPPYGLGMGVNLNVNAKVNYENKNWDTEIPSNEYFNELKRISKNQIVWGGNYFAHLWQEGCKGFICWNKLNHHDNRADVELAWTSFNKLSKYVEYMWDGNRYGTKGNIKGVGKPTIRIHPTQKPVYLYEWLLQNYAKEGDKILDTHLGSGSIAIACNRLKYELTACELDTEYFEASVKRYKEQTAQIQMF